MPDDGSMAAMPDDGKELRRLFALKHCRAAAKDSDLYMSMTFHHGAFRKLETLLRPSFAPARAPLDSLTIDGHMDLRALSDARSGEPLTGPTSTGDAPLAGQRVQDLVFWTASDVDIASKRRTKVPGEDSLHGDWSVFVHRVCRLDVASKTVDVSLQALDKGCVDCKELVLAFSPAVLSLEQIQGILRWSADRDAIRHYLDNAYARELPSHLLTIAPSLVDDLYRCRDGLPVSSLTPDYIELLDILAGSGLVQGPPWVLSPLGLERTQACVRLSDPHPMLCRTQGPLHEATVYQLILELDANTWRHVVVSRREAKDLPPSSLEEKIWYTIAGENSVSKYYLLALLTKPPPIPHCAKESEYKALLGLEVKPPSFRKRKGERLQRVLPVHGDCDWPEDDIPTRVPKARKRHVRGSPQVEAFVRTQAASPRKSSDSTSSSSTSSSDSPLPPAASPSGKSSSDNDAKASSSSSSSSSDSDAADGVDGDGDVAEHLVDIPGFAGGDWSGHFFTPVREGDAVVAWQVRCNHDGHNSCKKRRGCNFEGGEDACIRCLKQWIVLGIDVSDKTDHFECWKPVLEQWANGTLPSHAELDAIMGHVA